MTDTVIENGRVIDPASAFDKIIDVYLQNGNIVSIDLAPEGFTAQKKIDASGCLVIPGLVDLCARLREPGETHKATIASETAAACANGITSVCCLPNTHPVIDDTSVVELIKQRCDFARGANLHIIGALTEKLSGETLSQMASLKEAGCVALTQVENNITNTHVLLSCYQYAENFDIPVIVYAGDPFLNSQGIAHEGEVSTRLGLAGIPAASEILSIKRHLQLAEQTGVRLHFGKLSCAQSVDLIARAKAQGLRVTADVSIQHLFLTEVDLMDFNPHARLTPPLRTSYDRDALRQGVVDGVIDAICSDHQPHEKDAKLKPLSDVEPGNASFDTFLKLVLHFAEEHHMNLPDALARVTQQPAKIIGQPSGLKLGTTANLCVVDASTPHVVEAEKFHSAGKHSAFEGWRLPGHVKATWVNGELVYTTL